MPGEDVRGEDPADRIAQSDQLCRERCYVADDEAPGGGDVDHGSALKSPERPPAFSITRTSVIRIPRSSALHMS